MLVENSSKLHPELDFQEVRRLYVEAGLDKDIEGELITSPFDLFCVETLRDMHGLRYGDALPTDVFVFGKGEPPRRDCTKVGGLPYWPAGKPWPRTGDGTPYHFLAQFNFADSRDLITNLPGDVLLLLTDGPEEWTEDPDRLRFEWLPMGLEPCPEFAPPIPREFAGSFYAAIWMPPRRPPAGTVREASMLLYSMQQRSVDFPISFNRGSGFRAVSSANWAPFKRNLKCLIPGSISQRRWTLDLPTRASTAKAMRCAS
jgi:hypothetical protein